jgi:hypothetical protein
MEQSQAKSFHDAMVVAARRKAAHASRALTLAIETKADVTQLSAPTRLLVAALEELAELTKDDVVPQRLPRIALTPPPPGEAQ